ncbi:hypothetical protein H0H81_005791 [Sphagnurus paluster]|uniref:Uncharacterized protein n=1 Tax=Sphagnurus paluster TaxID=117069 RepID=A0A9P7GSK3_9AGAR|nr:hypothetical protein H0H81_005791 [Sphagnurus paluster]
MSKIWAKCIEHWGCSAHISLLKLWLERSRDHPLTISLRGVQSSERQDLLFENIYRWKTAAVTMDVGLADRLTDELRNNAPLLKSLNIFAANSHLEYPGITGVLASLPNLRQLSSSYTLLNNFSDFHWPKLTHLNFSKRLDTKECLKVLSCCPSIENAAFDEFSPLPQDLSHTPIITLPHLRTLQIYYDHDDQHRSGSARLEDAGQLLAHLTLPSLRTLLCPTPADHKIIQHLHDRSNCNIHMMNFDMSIPESAMIVHVELRCFQSLRYLHLFTVVSDALVLHLTWHPVTRPFLPHLKDVLLFDCRTTDGVLSDMVASRRKPSEGVPCLLERLGVQYHSMAPIEGVIPYSVDAAAFREFSAQGMRISHINNINIQRT